MTQDSELPKPSRSRLQLVLQAAGGLLGVLIGGFVFLYVYMFASMVDPRLMGMDRWAVILEKMFLTLSVIPVAFGGMMIVAGITLATNSFWEIVTGNSAPKRPAIVAVMLALLVSAVALMGLATIFM
jgi:hypothetical protein